MVSSQHCQRLWSYDYYYCCHYHSFEHVGGKEQAASALLSLPAPLLHPRGLTFPFPAFLPTFRVDSGVPQKLHAQLAESDVWAAAVHSQTLEPSGHLCKARALIMCGQEGSAAAPAHFQGLSQKAPGVSSLSTELGLGPFPLSQKNETLGAPANRAVHQSHAAACCVPACVDGCVCVKGTL